MSNFREILYGEHSRSRSSDAERQQSGFCIFCPADVSWFAAAAGEIRNDDAWKEILNDRMLVVSYLLQAKKLVEAGESFILCDDDVELLDTISAKLLDDAPDHQKMMTWKYQAGIQLRSLSECHDQRLSV